MPGNRASAMRGEMAGLLSAVADGVTSAMVALRERRRLSGDAEPLRIVVCKPKGTPCTRALRRAGSLGISVNLGGAGDQPLPGTSAVWRKYSRQEEDIHSKICVVRQTLTRCRLESDTRCVQIERYDTRIGITCVIGESGTGKNWPRDSNRGNASSLVAFLIFRDLLDRPHHIFGLRQDRFLEPRCVRDRRTD